MIDYSKYEFTDLTDSFEDRLSTKQGWGNLVPTSMGQTLIELNADASDYLGYMLERRIQELYLQTAKLETSVFAVASSFGYRPRRSIGASGTVKLELQDENGDPKPVEGSINIPKYSIVTGAGQTFFTTSEVTVSQGETEAELPISEGEIFTETYDPSNQSSTLYRDDETGKGGFILFPEFTSIDENYIEVQSGGETWFDVFEDDSSLAFESSTAAAYYVYYSHDGMRIQFGDGQFGRFPTDDVTVTWAETKGPDVRVSDIVSFSLEDSELEDDTVIEDPPITYQYTLRNYHINDQDNEEVVPISGGREFENIEDVKTQVPLSVRSNFRAVTTSDYDYWISREAEADVVDLNVFSEFEENTVVSGVNNVYVAYFTSTGTELSATQKTQIRERMEPYKVSTTHIVFTPAKLLDIAYDVRFKVNDNVPFANEEIYTIVRNAIESEFGAQEGSIGEPFYLSEMTRYLQNYEVERDGITYNLLEYLDIDVNGIYWLDEQDFYKKATIQFDSDITINDGETFAIVIDDDEYTFTGPSGGASLQDLRDDMFQTLTQDVSDVENNAITIEDTVPHRSFELTLSANNDFDSNITIERNTYVPIKPQDSSLSEQNLDDGILRGSLKIYERNSSSSDVLVYEDDGNGVLVADSGFSGNTEDGTINYKTGELQFSLLPDNADGYYIQYKQNEDNIFQVTANAYVDIIQPKENITDQDETLSTITIRN